MDTIRIVDLEVYAHHGVFSEENTLGQKFLISIDMGVDASAAGATDDLELSVDYGSACHMVHDYVRNNTFKLIESVAEHVAQEILAQYACVQQVSVEVKKPWAPIGLPVQYVSVCVTRNRGE